MLGIFTSDAGYNVAADFNAKYLGCFHYLASSLAWCQKALRNSLKRAILLTGCAGGWPDISSSREKRNRSATVLLAHVTAGIAIHQLPAAVRRDSEKPGRPPHRLCCRWPTALHLRGALPWLLLH